MPENDPLAEYRRRRDFQRTSEPAGKTASTGGRRYLIQKHAARRMHFDLRLQHEGVLKSWAVTRGPSLDPGDKRLAVRTEDHPVEYGDFEGVIPRDQYGGGTVMLWDEGEWEPVEDPDQGLKEGKLKFRLFGERLRGGWTLVRMPPRKKEKRENWLLIKERDDFAVEPGDALIEAEKTSARSGRTMHAISKSGDVWDSDKGRRKPPPEAAPEPKRTASKPHGKTRLPAFVKPQLATLVDDPPEGDQWLHEIKYDGYRMLSAVAGDRVAMRTRNGLDWTEKFPEIAEALRGLDCRSAHIDGEVAVADDEGRTDFGALQNALSTGKGDIGYYVFDLLSLDGRDLSKRPLTERKAELTKLVGPPAEGPLRYSDHVIGHGSEVHEHGCELGLEGIIAKRAEAPYRSGRTRSWLKIKCGMGQEFIILGWRPSKVKGRAFSSLLLGAYDGDELRYRGRVGSGFSEAHLEDLAAKLKPLERNSPPADDVPREARRDARFVTPKLVAEIAFRGWTREGYIRQGSFKGLRADKPARQITRERPMASQGSDRSSEDGDSVHGVRITHPDRVLYPDQGVTKRAVIDHYLGVADRMLPHVKDRPLALVRCPSGHEKECFFQKHASPGFPDAFKAVEIKEKSSKDAYLYIRGPEGLIAAAQMGVLELHLWCSRVDKVERPDRLVFDLDPDEAVSFAAVKEGARELRDRLDDLGLTSFVMATGGKGLHVVVPLDRRHGWDDHKAFAEAIVRMMAEDSPDRYLAVATKAKRKGRIFLDYLRNGRGASAIAPYSTRAKAGAPVAWPLSWRALGQQKDAQPATVSDAARKVARSKDPWADYFAVRQALPLAKLGLS